MKKSIIVLLLLVSTIWCSYGQNLLNNEKDSLEHHETFYYTTLKEKTEFKQSLYPAFYVLIFDRKVDLTKLQFNINRWNDAPIIYLRHNGYFSFEVQEPIVTNFRFGYEGDLNFSGSFARLYKIAPPIIGSPYPDFSLNEISGSKITKDDLTGDVSVILLWNPQNDKCKNYFQILDEMATDYHEVNFVALSNVRPRRIKEFKDQHPKSNFHFVNDKFEKLGTWTNTIPGNGGVIFIVNKEGLLEYKNIISEDHPIFLTQLENNIQEKLNSLVDLSHK